MTNTDTSSPPVQSAFQIMESAVENFEPDFVMARASQPEQMIRT